MSASQGKRKNVNKKKTNMQKNSSLTKSLKIGIIVITSTCAVILLSIFGSKFLSKGSGELSIIYPFNGSCFPPEITAPIIWWEDTNKNSVKWRITIDFKDNEDPVIVEVDEKKWIPDKILWESIKRRSMEKEARLTVASIRKIAGINKVLDRKTISIITSKDSVNAQIYYRDVPLPFSVALKNVDKIKWRLGNISSDKMPPVVLTNLPVCGNCHSFSRDGKILGMDVDIGNDKGAYVITSFEENTIISRDKLISWSDFDKNVPTFGMLPRVSPSGRYVLAGIRDRSVFLPRRNILFSQIFFPVMGIIGYYDRYTGEIHALPGADNPEFVQANARWTPDEKYVIFARNKAVKLKSKNENKGIILNKEESIEVLGEEKYLEEPQQSPNTFCYSLYRVPFNNGKGGKPEPIPGASHNGMSNYFPAVSPDGKWIVFTRAHSFMLLQPDAKLYIIPAEGGEARLMNCNTERMNSWHSWSPNGRWLVFSSKVFTPNTQLFLTHIDENGNDTPPVLLHNFTPLNEPRGANIPEFVNIRADAKRKIHERFLNDYNYFRSGRIYEQFRMFDRAEEEYLKALKINPENRYSLYGLATLYAKQKDYVKAEREFKMLLKIDPNSPIIHKDLGKLYFTKNEYDKAEKEFKTVIRLNPKDAEAHYDLGSIYNLKGRLRDAAIEYQAALDSNPEDTKIRVGVHFNMGSIYIKVKNYENAKKEFLSVIKIEPENTDAIFNLGRIYKILKEFENAEKSFKKFIELKPEDVSPHIELGELYAEMKDYESAIKEFQTVLKVKPGNLFSRIYLGRIYMEKGDFNRAEEEFLKILSTSPNNIYAHINLGQLYTKKGDKKRAIEEFKKVVDINPKDSRACFMLGDLLSEQKGKAGEAIEYLKKGIALRPGYVDGYIMLGNSYLKVGNIQGAINAFEKALELKPEETKLREKIKELRSRIE